MIIGNKNFSEKGHTYIMGILNVTPDSFSDGGSHSDLDSAIFHSQKMINEGADIIDVGGESTRPGHEQISIQEEIDRVVPVIERLVKEFDTPVSIDTYKPEVLKAALDAGAHLANDIWGLKYDPEYGRIVADYGVPCCLMHNRENPVPDGQNLFLEITKDMNQTLDIARKCNIREDKIILDPGVGFGKTYQHNLEVINAENFMMPEGYPVLLGTSRKSVIGLTLDLPTDERVEGTLVTTVLAVLNGSMFVRVHDVKENYRAIKMMEKIRSAGR